MKDPREDDLPLIEVAQKYFSHTEATVRRWAANRHKSDCADKYPFPIYRLAGNKSPWMVKAADFKRFRDQVYLDHKNNQAVA